MNPRKEKIYRKSTNDTKPGFIYNLWLLTFVNFESWW